MSGEEYSFVQCVDKAEFNPAILTGSFQIMNGSGLSDSVKIWKMYNPSVSISIEISFDGITAHDFIPPLGTLIVDFETNHSSQTTYGNGTLYLRKGQLLWGRTASNPTFLQIIGYR
jgi:hypothetical protein